LRISIPSGRGGGVDVGVGRRVGVLVGINGEGVMIVMAEGVQALWVRLMINKVIIKHIHLGFFIRITILHGKKRNEIYFGYSYYWRKEQNTLVMIEKNVWIYSM
jgi:hypothetical protein